MQPINIQPSRATRRALGFVVFGLGFRPFFLAAGIAAPVLLGIWVAAFSYGQPLRTYYGAIGWHSHEMVFGFTVGVIAGFLLTAVRNWTGRTTLTGVPLALLALLWLAGRILPFFPDVLPGWLIVSVDAAFLPLLAAALAVPLVIQRKLSNLMFVPILLLFAFANVLIHMELLGWSASTAAVGINLAIDLVVLVMVIMGGRVIPFFTERAVTPFVARRWGAIEALAPISIIVLAAGEMLLNLPVVIAVLAFAAAAIHGVRVAGWQTPRLWRNPLLWILHLGYAWIVVGLLLEGFAALGMVPAVLATHAYTAGAIGALTLGMMSRVALGHTGRPLQTLPFMSVAFLLVNLGALVRVIAPIVFPLWYGDLILWSGTLWIIAFAVFAVIYAPILMRARVDGRAD